MAKINCLPEKRLVEIDKSQTILEALLADGIPHTHVCGGQAYCSTCRITILEGIEHCSPPTSAERVLAKKLEFPFHVRLACQTKVSGDTSIRRLVLDNQDIDFVESQFSASAIGSKRTIAVLFTTIQGSTNFDEANFHYDMVYIMSRYFQRMHKAIDQYGGTIDNYIGHWFLAVFGVEDNNLVPDRAVWAGLEMLQQIRELNTYLEQLSYSPLKLNIGIHYGPVVLIPVNPEKPTALTFVGDVITWVSRIEAANRKVGSELLVSQSVYEAVRDRAIVNRRHNFQVPGKNLEFKVFEITQMQGEAPPKISKPETNEPLTKRIFTFVQKFAGSWSKSS